MAPAPFRFDNSYARLPERFFARVRPTPVADPSLLCLNIGLAEELGLNAEGLATATGVAVLAGNSVPEGSDPIAMAYAGHQFGHFVPQLGDGRAILLGELEDSTGARRDIQLKGAGTTPFSRRGDGRAALGPVLREFLLGEAMSGLGIPTTRGLAAVSTGEVVYREEPLPGAVLTRIATCHVRVGTFQYFAARKDPDAVRTLASYVIDRIYPAAREAENPFRSLLDHVVAAQARLLAQWMCVGFIHGVMNTDNTSIAGETIDYGPCAFMDTYNPSQVYSSIDSTGRYAFANQPPIAQWNLARFAETLLFLLASEKDVAMRAAQEAIDGFRAQFETAWAQGLRRKLGLRIAHDDDFALANDLLTLMAENRADFTNTFRGLIAAAQSAPGSADVRQLFADPTAFDRWQVRWKERLRLEAGCIEQSLDTMRSANPAYIPRNHLVEEVIRAALSRGDLAPFETLLAVLRTPFADKPGHERYASPPRPEEVVERTFCGT